MSAARVIDVSTLAPQLPAATPQAPPQQQPPLQQPAPFDPAALAGSVARACVRVYERAASGEIRPRDALEIVAFLALAIVFASALRRVCAAIYAQFRRREIRRLDAEADAAAGCVCCEDEGDGNGDGDDAYEFGDDQHGVTQHRRDLGGSSVARRTGGRARATR